MKRLLVIGLLLSFPAFADDAQPTSVVISPGLSNRISNFLLNGGTYAAATGLAVELQTAAEEPMKEKKRQDDMQKHVQEALDKYKAEHPEPAK